MRRSSFVVFTAIAACVASAACTSRRPIGGTQRGSVAVIERAVAVRPAARAAAKPRAVTEPYDAYAQDPPRPPGLENRGDPYDHGDAHPRDFGD